MKRDKINQNSEERDQHQAEAETTTKKAYEKPKLNRHEKFPEVTNGFFGSFSP